MKSFLLILCAVILLCGSAMSDAAWTVFTEDTVPDALTYTVCEYSGDVTVTFLGDCTLGGTNSVSGKSFAGVVRRKGMQWPMRHLTRLTASDDLTVANLEGVLSDRDLKKEEKTYNFIGTTAYTAVLTEGSIEAVTLANNHAFDFGVEGYHDTLNALDAAGIAAFDSKRLAIWERDGLMIGFVGVSDTSGKAGKVMKQQINTLRELGCAAVIVYMHAGIEYESAPSNGQRAVAKRAAEAGADLLIGSHPHVVQGVSTMNGMPIVYSLGNCSFGGNISPKDWDAVVVQVVLSFEEGILERVTLHLYPISISGNRQQNDYSPVFLTGKAAQRVLNKMEKSTRFQLPDMDEEQGAVVVFDTVLP